MKSRLWFSRLGVALVTIVALGAPLLMGLVGYLAISDGIDWSASDPLRAGRMFMLRENRRMTGIGIVTKSATSDVTNSATCARTHYTALIWSPALMLDRNSATCTCYAPKDGQLRDTTTPCAP
jgi:hypothetical protein